MLSKILYQKLMTILDLLICLLENVKKTIFWRCPQKNGFCRTGGRGGGAQNITDISANYRCFTTPSLTRHYISTIYVIPKHSKVLVIGSRPFLAHMSRIWGRFA